MVLSALYKTQPSATTPSPTPFPLHMFTAEPDNLKSNPPFQRLSAHIRCNSGCPYLRDGSVSDVHLRTKTKVMLAKK